MGDPEVAHPPKHRACCYWSFTGNVRVMMSTVYATAWAYFLPPERTGTPPVGWPGRRPSLEWTGHIKC
jgi:hypothetical protein